MKKNLLTILITFCAIFFVFDKIVAKDDLHINISPVQNKIENYAIEVAKSNRMHMDGDSPVIYHLSAKHHVKRFLKTILSIKIPHIDYVTSTNLP